MKNRTDIYLYDILNAIELIKDFTKNIYSYNDYVDDIKTKSAVDN